MQRKFATVLALAPLLLSGCATTEYVEPAGSAATLTIQNASTTADVGIRAFKVARDCSGGSLEIGDDGRVPAGEHTNVRVNADQEFSFLIQFNLPVATSTERYCSMVATFVPRQGGKYLALVNLERTRCYLGVTSVTPAGEVLEPSFKLRKLRGRATGTAAACE